MGKCPECASWNSMVEEMMEKKSAGGGRGLSMAHHEGGTAGTPVRLTEIELIDDERLPTGMAEFDRVMGGGIVKGSLTLVGGDPGIGKSTLLLQIAKLTAAKNLKVLYVSGEESAKQIKLRAKRLGIEEAGIFLMAETDMDAVVRAVHKEKPDILVVDSIQTVYMPEITSSPGSVSQVREVTAVLMRTAKSLGMATFIIGHVTKSGSIAGPKVLEHIVDTVLYFEGEKYNVYRIIRSVKNRFGSTNEIGIFEMNTNGLEEVLNPSRLFLTNRGKTVSGSVTAAAMEGTRPVLVEIQALVSTTNFGTPRRMAVGVDYNKMAMLMAVLEKRVGMHLHDQDGYVNVVGGMNLDEPAADLGIIAAVASSFRNAAVDSDTVVIGEVGLTGEVRPVSNIQQRISEAVKLGFGKAIIPMDNKENLVVPDTFKVSGVNSIEEAFAVLFGR